jgi:hypothetical protein
MLQKKKLKLEKKSKPNLKLGWNHKAKQMQHLQLSIFVSLPCNPGHDGCDHGALTLVEQIPSLLQIVEHTQHTFAYFGPPPNARPNFKF